MANPTVGDVTKQARAYLNDVAASKYTDQVLLPLLQGALDELEDALQENGAETVDTISSTLAVPLNTLAISYVGTTPVLPSDLVEPTSVQEKSTGAPDSAFVDVAVVIELPVRQQDGMLNEYLWQEQSLKFVGATQARDIRIMYEKGFARLTDPVNTAQIIAYNEALPFLAFKSAAMAAELIAQNHDRASVLHQQAEVALARTLNVRARSQQELPVRHRGWSRATKRGRGRSIYRTR